MNYDDIVTTLRSNGYKITPQRQAIILTLINSNSSLLSADHLYHHTKQLYEKTNRSTIYRNLEIFESLNLLLKITDNGITLYKLICTQEGHHHHLICKNCGKIESIDYCPMDILQKLSKEKQFHLTDHKLELYGQCEKCNADIK